MREYDRRRAARRARARARFGPLGVAVVALRADPASTLAWKQGAEGEARAAHQLARHLAGRDVVLLHDRRIPGRGAANIDHLAIGAGGITVIDTKSAHGRLRIQSTGGLLSPRREVLLVNGRERTHLLDALARQAARVAAAIRNLLEDELDIRGALCYPHIDGLPARGCVAVRGGTIAIGAPRGVAKLAHRRGAIPPAQVQLIADHLARRFPAA